MLNDVLFPILVFFPLYTFVGYAVEKFLRKKEEAKEKQLAHLLSIWFLLGAGLTTYIEFMLSIIGIPFYISLILLALCSSLCVIRDMRNVSKKSMRFQLPLSNLVFWTFMAVMLFFFFTRSVSRVMYTWDATAFWIPKMVALFQDQTIRVQGLIKFNHPEYPLLLPLIGANSFTLLQKPDEIAAKAVLFGFTIALFFIAGDFLLQKTKRLQAFFWMTLFLSLFILREHVAGEYVGISDILVGTYVMSGSVALLKKRPLLALVLWLLAAWTKSEGLVFAGVVTVLIFATYKKWRGIILFLAGFFVIPWKLLMKFSQIDSSQYFKFSEIYKRPWLEYATYSVHAFREEFRNLQKWNLLFFFFLSSTLTQIRKILSSKELFIIYAGLVSQLVMYMIIFTITPEEQASFISAAISRLTLHFAPTALVLSAYLLSEKTEKNRKNGI